MSPDTTSELLHHRTLSCPEGEIHSIVSASRGPDEPRILLVHGFIVPASHIRPLAEQLAPRANLAAPDLPGFGESVKPPFTLSLSQLADSLAHVMDAMKWDRAVVAGSSFGCQIASEFAVRHTARLSHLVLTGPTMDRLGRTIPRQFVRWIRNSRREPGGSLLKHYRRAGFGRVWRTSRVAINDRIEERMWAVGAPTLILRGENDPICPQRWVEELAKQLPHGRVAIIKDAAHTIERFAPKQVSDEIFKFLDDAPW